MRTPAFTLAAVLAAGVPVHADNALRPERIPNKARELAIKGRKHHQAGDYEAAVAAFKEAYVLAPSPGLLFNIAQSYRLAGNCDDAAWMYRRFLDTNPRGKQRQLAESQLAVVEKCGTGGLRITVAPPTLDTKIPDPPPTTSAARRAATAPLSLHASPPSRGSAYKRAGFYTAVGGGAALVAAAAFAVDADNAANTVEQIYARGGKWSDVKDDDARGQRSAMLATVLGIGGGAAVITGAVLYGLGRHYEHARFVAVTPTTRGAQVSLSWGF